MKNLKITDKIAIQICYVFTAGASPRPTSKSEYNHVNNHLYCIALLITSEKGISFWKRSFGFRFILLRRRDYFCFFLLRRFLMLSRCFLPWFYTSSDTRWWRDFFKKSRFPCGSCRRGSAFYYRLPRLMPKNSWFPSQDLWWICFTLFCADFCLTALAEPCGAFLFCWHFSICFRLRLWMAEEFYLPCFLRFSARSFPRGFRRFSACFCWRFYGFFRYTSFLQRCEFYAPLVLRLSFFLSRFEEDGMKR